MQRVHTLAQRRTVIEAPGLGLDSLQDVHTLICRLKSSSLNSPSICENESCTELEEEMLNKGSLTLAMGKCLRFSVKIKVCQSSLSSP